MFIVGDRMNIKKILDSIKAYSKSIGIEILIILVIFGGIGGFLYKKSVDEKDGNIKLNNTLSSPKKYGILDIVKISAYKKNKENHFVFDISNNTDKMFESKKVKLLFLDEDKKIMLEDDILLHDIEPGKKIFFDYILQEKYLNAYTFVIVDDE